MTCPKCGCENVSTSVVQNTQLVNKHHGILWWLCVGWWWLPIKWLCFTLPALLVKIFIPRRQKVKQTTRTVCVCQQCGNTWYL